MKWLAGLAGLCGIGMLLNAISGKWAFNMDKTGTSYVLADIGIALALFVASFVLWGIAQRQAFKQEIRQAEMLRRRQERESE